MPLDIINCARGYVRAAPIGALSENTQDAIAAMREYRKALRWLVGKTEWNCQTVTVCPDELKQPECCDIPQGFKFAFAYPDDALRLASVCYKQDPDCPPHDVPPVKNRVIKLKGAMRAQKAIVVDCKPILIEYVCLPDDCDVEAMSEDMRDALTHRIAMQMFLQQGDSQKAGEQRQLSQAALMEARTDNAQQGDRGEELECGFLVEGRRW